MWSFMFFNSNLISGVLIIDYLIVETWLVIEIKEVKNEIFVTVKDYVKIIVIRRFRNRMISLQCSYFLSK